VNRTVALSCGRAIAAALVLVPSLLPLGGCWSGEGDGPRAGEKSGLDRSEFIAIKKGSKNSKDFRQALRNEKFQKQGIVVEPPRSGKSARKGR
jgi:hypothetical protein